MTERLRQVHALIILFGKVRKDWVDARLGEAVKIAISESLNDLSHYFICLMPGLEESEGITFNHPVRNLTVLDYRQGLTPESLTPLLTSIRGAV